MSSYSISTYSMKSFDETIELVKLALKEDGFGVLTEIDVRAKMKEKLDKEMRPYLILGACHPPSAFKALELEEEIGLFLPCNVIVYEDETGAVRVGAIRPSVAMSRVDNPNLKSLAETIEATLTRVISKI
ncbi:MAG: DUF302 domain-containing protein [Patescibacteria group bacterium]